MATTSRSSWSPQCEKQNKDRDTKGKKWSLALYWAPSCIARKPTKGDQSRRSWRGRNCRYVLNYKKGEQPWWMRTPSASADLEINFYKQANTQKTTTLYYPWVSLLTQRHQNFCVYTSLFALLNLFSTVHTSLKPLHLSWCSFKLVNKRHKTRSTELKQT